MRAKIGKFPGGLAIFATAMHIRILITVLLTAALTIPPGCGRRPSVKQEDKEAARADGYAEAEPHFRPGDIVPDSYLSSRGDSAFFSCQAVPDSIFTIMQGRSWKEGCPLDRYDLRYITCLHRDAEGRTKVGEMVLNSAIAADVLEIFRQLYHAAYPIESMRLIDLWDADDGRSMADNNSSCFNFRPISGSGKISRHGLGMAVDINPLYNPYMKRSAYGTLLIEPDAGRPYINRSDDFPYKIEGSDLCCTLFRQHGFRWGGGWASCKDWQHFER